MPKVNTQITKRDFKEYDILYKSLMVHGPTGTGKSKSTLYFASAIAHLINVAVVFCPTNVFHNDWSSIVPDMMIRETLSLQAIEAIIKDQEDKTNYKKLAREHRAFWKQIPGSAEIDAEYEAEKKAIADRVEQNKMTMNSEDYTKAAHEQYVAKFNRNKKSRELIYKKISGVYRKNGIDRDKLDKTDKTTIDLVIFHKYFRLNINVLLVIDDCTDQFKSVPDDTWKLLFNKSRHFKLTVIMGTHNLGDIKVQCLRTAPTWQVFMTAQAAIGYLTNGAIGLKTVIIVDSNALSKAFSIDKEKSTMTRVALSRDMGIVTKFTYPAKLSFKLCDPVFWKVDEIMRKKKKTHPVRIDITKL